MSSHTRYPCPAHIHQRTGEGTRQPVIDAVPLQPREQFLVVAGVVLDLVHRQQAFLADRFHADADVEDSGLGGEIEQVLVVIRVDRP